jgi:hypothetical protein
MVTVVPLEICHATAPVTSPPARTRSTITRSPALRMPLLRVTAPRSVFDTAGPVLRKST